MRPMQALKALCLALFLAGPARAEPSAGSPESWTGDAGETLDYFGNKYKGQRIVFCLDTSLSMKQPVTGPASQGKPVGGAPSRRIDLAREELAKAIRNLPENKEFAVVFFDGEVSGWPKGRKLKPASPGNKKEAVERIEKKDLVFGTDILGALEEAFAYGKYDKVDTIILLTDGAPYTLKRDDKKKDGGKSAPGAGPHLKDGVRSDPRVILETVAKLNKKRGIVIHTIALGGNCRVDFLTELAKANGGTFLQVDAGTAEEPTE